MSKFTLYKELRRAERKAAWEAEQAAKEEERARVEALPLYLRIEEAKDMDDIKEILHILADKLEPDE